jgi:hypothetical protein
LDKKSAGDKDEVRIEAQTEAPAGVIESADDVYLEAEDGVVENAEVYHEVEELLARKLAEGEPDVVNAQEEAVKRLSPRWEIRIQTERDPIAEETKAYRAIAEEIDDRYDK